MRKPRRDKGQIRLNSRDLEVLRWIGEQYAVRLDSLQRLLGRRATQDTETAGQVSEATARRVEARWKQEAFVESRKLFYREPEWVWLTGRGLRQMGLPYKPKAPVVSQLTHLHLVNQLRLREEAKYGDAIQWRSERQIRHEHWHEPEFHVPDGELVATDDTVIALEIERTAKSRRRMDEIVAKLAQQYRTVWYFVTPTTRPLVAAATQPFGNTFRIYNLEEYVT